MVLIKKGNKKGKLSKTSGNVSTVKFFAWDTLVDFDAGGTQSINYLIRSNELPKNPAAILSFGWLYAFLLIVLTRTKTVQPSNFPS